MKYSLLALVFFFVFACQVRQTDKHKDIKESFRFTETQEYQQFKDSTWLPEILTIQVDDLFKDGQFYAFVNVGKPMLTEVPESYFYIYHYQGNEWKLISSNHWKDRFEQLSYLYAKDINFDEKEELVLRYHIYSASREICVYEIFDYNNSTKQQFKHLQTIFSTDSLHINRKDKTLLVGKEGGTFGISNKVAYQWKGNHLVEAKKILRCVIQRNDSIFVEIVEYALKNGEMEIVKEGYVNKGSDEEYFFNWGFEDN